MKNYAWDAILEDDPPEVLAAGREMGWYHLRYILFRRICSLAGIKNSYKARHKFLKRLGL